MYRLVKIELVKIFSKPRSYISFIAIALIVILIEAGIFIDGQGILDFFTQNIASSFYFQGNLLNGYLVSFIILNTLWIHIPILIAIVTGDLVAGESNLGTFRLLLTRPVSRSSLLFSKFIAGVIYSILVVLFLGLLSLLFGILFFGKGDLIVITNKINILPENDLVWRFLVAFGLGTLSMIVVAALSFLFSVFSTNSIGPIISTILTIIALSIISTFEIPVFSKLRPYLFTTYLNTWRHLFEFEVNTVYVIRSMIHLIVNLFLFYFAALVVFKRKDILT